MWHPLCIERAYSQCALSCCHPTSLVHVPQMKLPVASTRAPVVIVDLLSDDSFVRQDVARLHARGYLFPTYTADSMISLNEMVSPANSRHCRPKVLVPASTRLVTSVRPK